MSGVAGRAGPDQERVSAEKRTDRLTVRVTDDVHRQLVTLQYQARMAGEFVSLSDVIAQLLDRAGAA